MKRVAVVLAFAMLLGCGDSRSFKAANDADERRPKRAVTSPQGNAEDEAFRATPPAPLARKIRKDPTPTEARLTNGVRVVMLERHDFPSVSIAMVLDRGAAAGAPALGSIYAHTIRGTSKEYKGNDAWEYFRFVGATVHTEAWYDGILVQATALSPLYGSALSRAAPMFAEPAIDSEDVEHARATVVADYGATHEHGSAVADQTLLAGIYGSSAYGTPVLGTSIEQIRAVDRAALSAFRDANVSTDRTTVIAVGDFKPTTLLHALEKSALARIPKKKSADIPDAPTSAPPAHRLVVIDRPGAAQSDVAIGWRGPSTGTGDATALQVLSTATGNGLSSRLNLTVRKELGATYGLQMAVRAHRGAGAVVISGAIDTPRTGDALKGIFAEMTRLRAEPLSPAELTAAKEKTIYKLDQGTSAGLAHVLASIVAQDLSPSFLAERNTRIEALGGEDLRAAATKWLAAEDTTVVIVGDATRIGPSLAALGLGEPEIRR